MTYEVYRNKVGYDEFFSIWEEVKVGQLSKGLKQDIYNKYLVKCEVFNRDNFKCRNIKCKTPECSLTLHHVRWQKNGGKDSARNGLTLCTSCHKGYHRGKKEIVIADDDVLPSNIKGHTFKAHKSEVVSWKKLKKSNKELRKTLKHEFGSANWDLIMILMKWLEGPMV